MTVDQLPLASSANFPVPLPPSAGAGDEWDRLDTKGPPTNRPGPEAQPITPSGWPRIFPGL